MEETPGGGPEEPPQSHDEEQLPPEPYSHGEMPFAREHGEDPGEDDAAETRPSIFGEDEDADADGEEPGYAPAQPVRAYGHEHGEDAHAHDEDAHDEDAHDEDAHDEDAHDEDAHEHEDGEHAGPPLFGAREDAVGEHDDEEHHTVESEPAGDLGEDTALHQIDDDAEVDFDYHSFDDADYESLEEQIHSPEEIRLRRLEERAARRRAGRQRLLALIGAVIVVVIIIVVVTSGGGGPKTPPRTVAVSLIGATGSGPGYLAAGSAAAVPTNILIADRNNRRVLAITPQGQAVWSHNIGGPSDAYPTSTARSIVVTEHSVSQVLVLSVARGSITFHYGHANVASAGSNRLHDPSAAQYLPDGRIVIADKANCRVLLVRPPHHEALATYGTPSSCVHKPLSSLGYPDGAFPTTGGGLVVTEETPGWIDLVSQTGKLVKQFQVAGLTAPYAANQTPDGNYIATNYAHPGSVVEFDSSGHVTWSYGPTSGAGELDFPTLAIVLSNGNVLISDARNDRVIVIDPSSKQIVWQYGHTGKPGSSNGYLHTPDSAVPVPVPAS